VQCLYFSKFTQLAIVSHNFTLLKLQWCLSVRAVSRHCPDRQTDTNVVLFSVIVITQLTGGGGGGQHGGGRTGRGGLARARGGTGGGKLDECIMHQVHTSFTLCKIYICFTLTIQ
jgi:hypothetical protein